MGIREIRPDIIWGNNWKKMAERKHLLNQYSAGQQNVYGCLTGFLMSDNATVHVVLVHNVKGKKMKFIRLDFLMLLFSFNFIILIFSLSLTSSIVVVVGKKLILIGAVKM